MESKNFLLACLNCGEYVKGHFKEVIAQSELHMCSIVSTEQKKDSLMKMQKFVDGEIAKASENKTGGNIFQVIYA